MGDVEALSRKVLQLEEQMNALLDKDSGLIASIMQTESQSTHDIDTSWLVRLPTVAVRQPSAVTVV